MMGTEIVSESPDLYCVSTHGVCLEHRKERDRLKGLGLDERITVKCILKIRCEVMDLIHLVQDRCREYGDEPVGPIKCGVILDYLKTYCLLKNDCAS